MLRKPDTSLINSVAGKTDAQLSVDADSVTERIGHHVGVRRIPDEHLRRRPVHLVRRFSANPEPVTGWDVAVRSRPHCMRSASADVSSRAMICVRPSVRAARSRAAEFGAGDGKAGGVLSGAGGEAGRDFGKAHLPSGPSVGRRAPWDLSNWTFARDRQHQRLPDDITALQCRERHEYPADSPVPSCDSRALIPRHRCVPVQLRHEGLAVY